MEPSCRGDGQKGKKDNLGVEENVISWSGLAHSCCLLEGRRPGPPGDIFPSLALQLDSLPDPGPGEGPEGCHGGYSGEVGALPLPTAPGTGARATGAASLKTVQGFCAAHSHRLSPHGPVYTDQV